jgi:hypothetical protein
MWFAQQLIQSDSYFNTMQEPFSELAENRISLLGLELEYKTLRDEIVKRIELRQQIVAVTLTLAGVFLSVGLAFDAVVLIYPILALFLALGWAQNDLRIASTATYIRENIEPSFPGLNFETWNQQRRGENKRTGPWRFVVLSHGGVFLVTSILAIGIGLANFVLSPIEILLLVCDFISLGLVFLILSRSRRV